LRHGLFLDVGVNNGLDYNAFCVSGCLIIACLGSLKMSKARFRLHSMERRRLADSLSNSQTLLNTPFGDKPSLFHFKFQAALTHKAA